MGGVLAISVVGMTGSLSPDAFLCLGTSSGWAFLQTGGKFLLFVLGDQGGSPQSPHIEVSGDSYQWAIPSGQLALAISTHPLIPSFQELSLGLANPLNFGKRACGISQQSHPN